MRETRTLANDTLSPSLDEFKAHIRYNGTDLDADLTAKLRAAIVAAEGFISQVLAVSTFVKSGEFAHRVPLCGPVITVTGVKVDDVTVSADNYKVDDDFVLSFADSVEGSSLEVTYQAGIASVPDDIKAAVLLHAAALFNNPVDSVETLPKASSNLLRRYRRWELSYSAAPIKPITTPVPPTPPEPEPTPEVNDGE